MGLRNACCFGSEVFPTMEDEIVPSISRNNPGLALVCFFVQQVDRILLWSLVRSSDLGFASGSSLGHDRLERVVDKPLNPYNGTRQDDSWSESLSGQSFPSHLADNFGHGLVRMPRLERNQRIRRTRYWSRKHPLDVSRHQSDSQLRGPGIGFFVLGQDMGIDGIHNVFKRVKVGDGSQKFVSTRGDPTNQTERHPRCAFVASWPLVRGQIALETGWKSVLEH
jgi:hypothetical protein